MNGLGEIRQANRVAKCPDYRVQRDKLAQAVTRLLANEVGAEQFARKALAEVSNET